MTLYKLLTSRERAVAGAACEGLTIHTISVKCAVTPATVRTYLKRIYGKCGVNSRPAMMAYLQAHPEELGELAPALWSGESTEAREARSSAEELIKRNTHLELTNRELKAMLLEHGYELRKLRTVGWQVVHAADRGEGVAAQVELLRRRLQELPNTAVPTPDSETVAREQVTAELPKEG
jgi:DNA-binding CsgD family transcriptional regulator